MNDRFVSAYLRALVLVLAACASLSGCGGFEDGACYVGQSCTDVSIETCSLEGGTFQGGQSCSTTHPPRITAKDSQTRLPAGR